MILEFYKIQPWLVQLDPCGHGPEEEKKRLYLGHGFPAKVWAFSLMERKPYPSTREKKIIIIIIIIKALWEIIYFIWWKFSFLLLFDDKTTHSVIGLYWFHCQEMEINLKSVLTCLWPAAPAYCTKDYTRNTVDHAGKSMTASLAIQDRKKSTTSDKVYAAILCCAMKCSLQDKSDLQGKSNHRPRPA
jgi:hypothetical protein